VIQPAHSRYNSPIFAVMKKDGGRRLVQDFCALNNQSYMDKYSMKDVSECISKIGCSGSTIFSTIYFDPPPSEIERWVFKKKKQIVLIHFCVYYSPSLSEVFGLTANS
jgi:hypothetical protein